ncbi:MAG TPA: AI-2E family transporter [Gemmatimonadaceae bacterium]|jgi:predicted PurR-regulated permease PerM|nr:AI-2E family transporter [Gemmatimonadaceae bacterium]
MSPDETSTNQEGSTGIGQPPPGAPGTEEAPPPDIQRAQDALESRSAQSVGITILVVLAVAYTLYFGRALLLPFTLAVLLKSLLGPVIRSLARMHITPPLGAAMVMIVLLVSLGAAGYAVSGPAHTWLANAPETLKDASQKLASVRKSVQRMTRTAQQMEHATDMNETKAQEVVIRGPGFISRVFGSTTSGITAVLEVTILLYFLLAAGDLFLEKLVKMLPNLRDKKKAVAIARGVESSVSAYLVTITIINLCEGAVLAGILWLLGAPTPLLWGVLAAMLEYMPYVGAGVMIIVLLLVGLTTFKGLGHALALPGAFLALNLIQANIVSPLAHGRRQTLNPVAIFVGIAFWYFIWGILGAFVAVPLLATLKILCDHIESLAPIGEFLGRRDGEE